MIWKVRRSIERPDAWMRLQVKHLTLGRMIYTKEALELFAGVQVDGFIDGIRPAFNNLMYGGADDAPENPELN